MWHEVEILLEEMENFGIPLQESVMISVLSVCRGLGTFVRTPQESGPSSNFIGSNVTAVVSPFNSTSSSISGSSSSSSSGSSTSAGPIYTTTSTTTSTVFPSSNTNLNSNNVSSSISSSSSSSNVESTIPLKVSVSDSMMSSSANVMRSKVNTSQWKRTLWLIENYGLKATNVTESMYTMAMDVCESCGR